jgi:hypothetical protein
VLNNSLKVKFGPTHKKRSFEMFDFINWNMALATSLASTMALDPGGKKGIPFLAALKMANELLFQSPGPKMTHGLIITAFKPSSIPRQTSFSAKNFETE